MRAPPRPTGQPVRIAGLAADDYGSSDDRPPLVLLHGMTFDRTMWRDIIPELQRIDPGRRVRGDRPARARRVTRPAAYELDTIVEQIHRVVEEAGLTRPCSSAIPHPAASPRLRGASPQPRRRQHRLSRCRSRRSSGSCTRWATGCAGPSSPPVAADLLRQLARRAAATRRAGAGAVHLPAPPAGRPRVLAPAARAARRRGPRDDRAGVGGRAASGMPYLYIAGDDLEPGYRQWLDTRPARRDRGGVAPDRPLPASRRPATVRPAAGGHRTVGSPVTALARSERAGDTHTGAAEHDSRARKSSAGCGTSAITRPRPAVRRYVQ